MNTRTGTVSALIRFGFLATMLVLAGLTSVHRANANQSGPSVEETATMQILLCRNFGGQADVEVTRTGNGFVGIWVVCKGGFLDGMDCATGPGPDGTNAQCKYPSSKTREVIQVPTQPTLPEPVVKDGDSDAPAIVEPTVIPEPEPTNEVVIDEPVVDDGGSDEIAPPVDEGQDDDSPVVDDGSVVENPVVSDEPTVKDQDPGPSKGDPGIRDPQILPDDIKPIEEPIILT